MNISAFNLFNDNTVSFDEFYSEPRVFENHGYYVYSASSGILITMQCWHLDLSTLAIMVLVVLADLQSLVVECLGKYAVGMEMQSIWPCLDSEHAACSWRSSGQRTHVNTQIHKRKKRKSPYKHGNTNTQRDVEKTHRGKRRQGIEHAAWWWLARWFVVSEPR